VEPGQGEEGSTEQVGAQRQTFILKRVEFVYLEPDKHRTHCSGGQKPNLDAFLVVSHGGGERLDHAEAATQEDEGADRRNRDVYNVDRIRANETLATVHHVGGY
jgi:hypothetical protein